MEKGDFMDAAYLLLNGDLPAAAEKQVFVTDITRHTLVHEQLIQFYKGFRHDAHPMAIMVGVVGALSAFYNDSRMGAAAEFECASHFWHSECDKLRRWMPAASPLSLCARLARKELQLVVSDTFLRRQSRKCMVNSISVS